MLTGLARHRAEPRELRCARVVAVDDTLRLQRHSRQIRQFDLCSQKALALFERVSLFLNDLEFGEFLDFLDFLDFEFAVEKHLMPIADVITVDAD